MSAIGPKRTCAFASQESASECKPDMTHARQRCPLYPQERTYATHKSMSAKGQKRTLSVQIERPPRGGLSEIELDVLVMQRVPQPSSSCASQADPTRRGQWRKAGGQQAVVWDSDQRLYQSMRSHFRR